MSEEFVIEEMTLRDLDDVLDIETACFKSPWSRELFLRELELEFSFSFVAKRVYNGKKNVVAYIVFWIVKDDLYLLDLAVDDGFRGRGLARRLIKLSLDMASGRACTRALLEVRKGNLDAINLYRLLDFKVTGSRPRYYGDGEDAVLMCYNISNPSAKGVE